MVLKSRHSFLLINIFAGLVFISSCKKDDDVKKGTVNDTRKKIFITVKDYSTNQPVQGASVMFRAVGFFSGEDFSGVTDASGIALIRYDESYSSLNEYNATMSGYEPYCESYGFSSIPIPATKEILLLKRDSYIQFRFLNSGAVFPQDSLVLSLQSNHSYCSGGGHIYLHPGTPVDTTIVYSSVPGSIDLDWRLYRNNDLVIGGGSSADVTVPIADTLLFDINY
jgi:hypothetical protein